MYPGSYAECHPDRPAFIMAASGETVSYREFEGRANQLAHLLRAAGLKRLDHYSIFMENNDRYLECCAAGERSGLYYTCINHYLKADELAYILNNSESQVLIVSLGKLPVALAALRDCPAITRCLVAGAAPCPAQGKEQMIDWWGPIIHEYYGATEGLGFAALDSEEWLAHRGSVDKVILGELHVLDEAGNECPEGTPGELWFKTATDFSYFNNAAKTAEATSADGTMSTVGDVGYVKDGYLYLTERSTFMIISGGVNIYPQETEDLLITHPKVADAAVFGVPNEDLGEEVKAVVQPLDGVPADAALADELMAFYNEHLSRQKCPRSIDFDPELPRLPTGKLYKRVLKDRYWQNHSSSIL